MEPVRHTLVCRVCAIVDFRLRVRAPRRSHRLAAKQAADRLGSASGKYGAGPMPAASPRYHRQPEPWRLCHLQHGAEFRVADFAERAGEDIAGEAGVLGDLGYAAGADDDPKRVCDEAGIVGLEDFFQKPGNAGTAAPVRSAKSQSAATTPGSIVAAQSLSTNTSLFRCIRCVCPASATAALTSGRAATRAKRAACAAAPGVRFGVGSNSLRLIRALTWAAGSRSSAMIAAAAPSRSLARRCALSRAPALSAGWGRTRGREHYSPVFLEPAFSPASDSCP